MRCCCQGPTNDDLGIEIQGTLLGRLQLPGVQVHACMDRWTRGCGAHAKARMASPCVPLQHPCPHAAADKLALVCLQLVCLQLAGPALMDALVLAVQEAACRLRFRSIQAGTVLTLEALTQNLGKAQEPSFPAAASLVLLEAPLAAPTEPLLLM